MLFTRSKTHAFPPEFSMGDTDTLDVKKTLRILGVLVQDDRKWSAQVEEMVRRATRTTWVLRRMRSLGVDHTTLVAYWKDLEFACPVWHSGLTSAQAKDLERAQRMAMAAITGRWEPSHTQQLLDLGLDRLGSRRELLCRTFAKRTALDSQHMDLFTPTGSQPRRGKLMRTYRTPFAHTQAYYNYAVPYLTRLLIS